MAWIWHMCFTNMKQRGARTWLTILGVVIGVVSIVSMLAIGIGVKKKLMTEFENNGSVTEITITGVSEGKRKDKMITDKRLREIADMKYVKEVYPQLSLFSTTKYERYTGYVDIIGVPESYLKKFMKNDGQSLEGNRTKPELYLSSDAMYMFYNESTGSSFVEINEDNMDKLNLTGESMDVQLGMGENAPISRLKVGGMLKDGTYNVYCNIEVLKKYLKRMATDGLILGQPTNENGVNYKEWIYNTAIIDVEDAEHVEKVVEALQDMGFQTENNKELLDSMQNQLKMIQLLLGGIGMIALIVAVIGIINTMTTSVYERISDIGILKVLGCDTDDLLYLFFLESGILGGVGGLIGILISYLISTFGINRFAVRLLSIPKGTELAIMPWWLAVSAVLFAIVLGVLAGYFPARWAAKLKPIEAMGKNG